MWREGLGAYKIIIENRTDLSYWKHPATQEFVNAPVYLWIRLKQIRKEMLNRGYHPKELPEMPKPQNTSQKIKQWQTLEQQIEIIKSKKCKCKINICQEK